MLSAQVLTKNNEATILACLKSLSFVHEIIIIDSGSTDKTLEIARRFTQKILHHDLDGDFAAQRNFGLTYTQAEWILSLDSDEVLPEALQEEIKTFLADKTQVEHADGGQIKRVDQFWGAEVRHGEVAEAANTGFVRLVKKGSGSWHGKVHEIWVFEKEIPQIHTFTNPMRHFAHQNLKSFIAKINTYSTIRATEIEKAGVQFSAFKLIVYPLGKFFYTYILRGGFLDGAAGFVYSFLMSFHSFLVRAKLHKSA